MESTNHSLPSSDGAAPPAPNQSMWQHFILSKPVILGIILLIMVLSWLNMMDGLNLVGRTFPGFGTMESFCVSQVFYDRWTGYQHIETLTRIVAVNGQPPKSIQQLYEWVINLPPDTNIIYTIQRSNGELVQNEVQTMVFSWLDFIRVYLPFQLVVYIHLFMALFIVYASPNYRSLTSVLGFTLVVALAAALFCDFQFYNFRFSVLGAIAYIAFGGSFLYMGLVLNRRHFSDRGYRRAVHILFWSYGLHMFLFTGCFYWLMWLPLHPINPSLQEVMASMDIMAAVGIGALPLLAAFALYKSPDDSLERKQARMILTGAILTCTPLFLLFYLPQFWTQTQMVSSEWVVLPFNAFPILIAWAMIKHHAFDVEVYIRKILIYYALTGLILFFYAMISFILTYSVQSILQLQDQVTILVAALLAYFFTSRFYERIQHGIDRIFYRQKIDWEACLTAFETEASAVMDKEKLALIALQTVDHCFHPLDAALYLQNETEMVFIQSLGMPYTWPPFLPNLGEGLPNSRLKIPVQIGNNTVAWLFLGSKKSESDYLTEDHQFLSRFANHLAPYLQSTLMSEKVLGLLLEKTELTNRSLFIRQLAANLSHDFKSPLSSCYALVNKLLFQSQHKALTPKVLKQELQKLLRCFDKFSHYINLSLDREMLEKGRLILQQEHFCPKLVCQDVLDLHRDAIEKAGLKVDIHFSDQDILLNGDRVRFEQTVSNLLSNAMKHAKKNIQLFLKEQNNLLILQIQDDGEGVAPEKQAVLFQPYVSDGRSQGTGLGLWISQNYIQLMGGQIRYEIATHPGATFTIAMPCQVVADTVET